MIKIVLSVASEVKASIQPYKRLLLLTFVLARQYPQLGNVVSHICVFVEANAFPCRNKSLVNLRPELRAGKSEFLHTANTYIC